MANNAGKAELLTQQADDLEEVVAKELADKSANVVMFDKGASLDASRDDMGIITVSQSLRTLGIIDSANSAALNMFGYNKRDLVGKNVSVIVPQPMSSVHDKYLQAFVESGHSVSGVLSMWGMW